jgi:4-amino-4-deoxy-L-arabinose transferase-like glycosyltransferase
MDDHINRGWQFLSPIVLIMALGAFLLLFHLDHRPFWQDEAETACLARNVLKYGLPRAYDGVNLISQEQGQEFDQNFLWRWSPWMQIYVTAAAFRIAGLNTVAGRLPFALMGIGCIFLVYVLLHQNFDDKTWACLAALLLVCSVPFLMFCRQCRYYSLGALLTLLSLYAFTKDWQTKYGPALLLCLSVGMLFYTNYLLFISFIMPTFLAAIWLYNDKLQLRRTLEISIATLLIILPGFFLFKIQQQSHMINLVSIPLNLEIYTGGLLQFMLPLPIGLYLLWRWRHVRCPRSSLPKEPGERFVLFLSLIISGNILLLSLLPQCEHRYLIHLYPLCAIILGWVVLKAWRYQKISGVLLGVLLLFTNWLYLVPMDWLNITNRPPTNGRHMLTHPNIPLKLFLTELFTPYADVNRHLIDFFQTHSKPGDVILTTYSDLPLQFYTTNRVIGGLQGSISLCESPSWVVPRWDTRWNRVYRLNDSELFIKEKLSLASDYQPITLPCADEIYGNRPDPYCHRFMPQTEPLAHLIIYRKRSPGHHVSQY